MLGRSGVVKLWPAEKRLVIGEGLETVLAAATRIPFEGQELASAWACLSAGKLAALPPKSGVERLIISVDNDEACREAGGRVAAVWRAAGREVTVLVPPTEGSDFNDLVLQEDNNAAAGFRRGPFQRRHPRSC